jgi:multimeric flavodoxin WrbA
LRRLFRVEDSPRITPAADLGLDEEVFSVDTTVIDTNVLESLIERTAQAQSVILSTPVYFGDRSSVVDVFLKILHQRKVIQGKAVSLITVGAKRNGGQETAAVYALFDAINMGAIAIGNGPKTSQYGGTAVAGDKGGATEDVFGAETAVGTGRRGAQVAKILLAAETEKEAARPPVKIAVLITADNQEREVQSNAQKYFDVATRSTVEYEIINLLDYRIERCLACKICPFPPMVQNGSKGYFDCGTSDYACIIDNGRDGMEVVREKLKSMDGLILVGINDDHYSDLVDSYQSFTERTRFIRRANFEWMNTPFTSFILKNVASTRDRAFGLRVMTSYIRHNTIACGPIRVLADGDEIIRGPEEALATFVDTVASIRCGRNAIGGTVVSYIAGGTGGYADTRLDHTTAVRT